MTNHAGGDLGAANERTLGLTPIATRCGVTADNPAPSPRPRPRGRRSSKRSTRARAIHWRYDSVMPGYRRPHAPGGTYFFAVNTYRRQTFLTDADVCSALREAIGTVRLNHPFASELTRTRALRSLEKLVAFCLDNTVDRAKQRSP